MEEMIVEEDLSDADLEAVAKQDETQPDDETLAMDHEFKKQASEADEDSGTFGFGLDAASSESDEIKEVSAPLEDEAPAFEDYQQKMKLRVMQISKIWMSSSSLRWISIFLPQAV